ncbi:MAG: LysM peptidoglycan-binding domain-containing protein [Lewinellaceae bacterium]|nr:LysM peptidoglycan-binding domain-containing protein [Lewinellaceae bacterium]
MKQMLLLLAVLTALTGLTAQTQQAPMYLLFNSSCMNQLEYRYTYTGASVMAYAYSPNANQTYILNAGNSGINAPSLPPGTLDCRSIKMDQTIMDAINKLQRQVYVVHQTQQGYLLMPLISAMQIERAGTYYFFRNPNYQFALDTMNLVYQANLSTAGSPNRVYFNGLRIMDCVYQYSFRSEPTQTNREKSDFEFIPSIGITVSNSGLTAAEMETNSLRLWRINGMSLEDYVSGMCHSGTSKPAAGIPAVAGVREDFQKTQPIGPPSPAPTVAPAPVDASGCTEVGGNGFHVVQKGETLMAISRQYKTPMKTLVAWNKIDNPDMIKPCQKLLCEKSGKHDGCAHNATTHYSASANHQPAQNYASTCGCTRYPDGACAHCSIRRNPFWHR